MSMMRLRSLGRRGVGGRSSRGTAVEFEQFLARAGKVDRHDPNSCHAGARFQLGRPGCGQRICGMAPCGWIRWIVAGYGYGMARIAARTAGVSVRAGSTAWAPD